MISDDPTPLESLARKERSDRERGGELLCIGDLYGPLEAGRTSL
jgi:hypothetical protein